MQYRNFGQLDWKSSALGFGTMRMPVLENDNSKIDEAEAIKMIRYAIDQGVNYIDTAWPYHQEQSEILTGKALLDGYREKVKLATKLPSWLIKSEEDMDKYLDKQLEKLQTDHIDFYLLHALNRDYWENYKKLNVFDWIEKVIAEGKIKHIGFSFHDDYDLFEELVDAYDKWDFCQIQYNYLDTDYQAGRKGLKYAADKGLAVVIMEPLRGGKLAAEPPQAIAEILADVEDKTPAARALQWLWNQPEVSVVLSGMSTMEQVQENVETAAQSGINTLSKNELNLIEKVRDKYHELTPILCTGCGYCIPCPSGVNIPGNFALYNDAHVYDDFAEKQKQYNKMKEDMRASSCASCGQCETVCPQNLNIIELLEEVDRYFTAK